MHVTDHMVSQSASHALDALTDYRRTQMAYVKRLGHIGSAVVHNNRLGFLGFLKAQTRICSHLIHKVCQEVFLDL